MKITRKLTRRSFLAQSTATLFTAASWKAVAGANERVRLGLIGFGLIGRIHARSFKQLPNAEFMGLAEVYQPRLDAGVHFLGGKATGYRDFRHLLERKDLDAVIIATPDHWHCLMLMMACSAGKDVYLEKPISLFVREGRWMSDCASRHGRVVQVGTQNRSGPNFKRARELIRSGKIGEVVAVQNNSSRNIMPGFGSPPDSEPPRELDWEMWLGPAPLRPYNSNRAIYHFRWFWDYSGGQMTNLGHHSFDLIHWILGVKAPLAVQSSGGRWFAKDNCEVPDVQDAIHEYQRLNVVSQYREVAASGRSAQGTGLTFQGTKGGLAMSRNGFEILPDTKTHPNNTVSSIMGGHPVGGPQPIAEERGQTWTEKVKDESGNGTRDLLEHARDFLNCVRSRKQPVSPLEESHHISTACHLANISLRIGRKIKWDAATESIMGDEEAARMLERPYRAPWDAELRALRG